MKKPFYKIAAIFLTLALTITAELPAQANNVEKTKVAKPKVEKVTRSYVVTRIWKLAGKPKTTGSIGFSDVKAWDSDVMAFRWAYRSGLIKTTKKVKPKATATREWTLTLLWKYTQSPEPDSSAKGFSDQSKVSKSAKTAVIWAKANKLTKGIVSKKLSPKSGFTKAQITKLLSNYKKGPGKVPALYTILGEENSAIDVAVAEDGSLMVVDDWNKQILRLGNGKQKVVAGAPGVRDVDGQPIGDYVDGEADKARFGSPFAITPFKGGWAVSDPDNKVVRLIKDGKAGTINPKSDTGIKKDSKFEYPTGLTTDEAGNLYVADTESGSIKKITPEGNLTILATGLSDPMGICYYRGSIYVAETGAHRISAVFISNKTVSVVAGSGEDGLLDGAAGEAQFSSPQGVTVGEDGTIYVADTVNASIRRIKSGKVTTILAEPAGLELWPASPTGLAVYGSRLYIADPFAKRVYYISI